MTDRDDDTISKKDIFNMMDSYKSNVEFNKELLESQVKILDQHVGIITNLNKINANQSNIGGHLEVLIDKLTCHNTNCSSNNNEAVTTTREGINKIDDHHIESIKSHSVLKNSILSGAGVLSGIVVSLVYIMYQLIDKSDTLQAIAKHLGD